MKFSFYSLAVLYSCVIGLSFGLANAGTIRCDCPTVSAKATGNSSCSATESDGECLIDFNTFDDEVERRARELVLSLSRPGHKKTIPIIPYFSRQKANSLRNDELVNLLSAYLMVSVIQNNSSYSRNNIRRLLERADHHKDDIANSFRSNGSRFNIDGILVTKGCIEVRIDTHTWAMFKAPFAEAAQKPQCNSNY